MRYATNCSVISFFLYHRDLICNSLHAKNVLASVITYQKCTKCVLCGIHFKGHLKATHSYKVLGTKKDYGFFTYDIIALIQHIFHVF